MPNSLSIKTLLLTACCCIRGKDPVVTPDGYLYSKEAILENLLQQKKAIKRKLAAYEAQQAEEQQKVWVRQQQ
jgi:nitric oxide synthase-interacting protein